MPRRDGMGPLGEGPMTGRAAGECAGYDTPAPDARAGGRRGLARGVGRGLGRGLGVAFGAGLGRGAGRGYRNRFYATGMPLSQDQASVGDTLTSDGEISLLKGESQRLKSVLTRIEQKLHQLDADKK